MDCETDGMAGPLQSSLRPTQGRSQSGSPESARGSVLLFVKRGAWNVERAGRRPAAEVPPTFRRRSHPPIRIHWVLRRPGPCAPYTFLLLYCSFLHAERQRRVSPGRASARRFSAREARSIARMFYCSLHHLRPQPPPPGVSMRTKSPGERAMENFPGSFLRRPFTTAKLLPILPGVPLASP